MLFIYRCVSNLKFLSSKFARHLCQLKVAAVKPPCSKYFPLNQFAKRRIPIFSSWNAAQTSFKSVFHYIRNKRENKRNAKNIK